MAKRALLVGINQYANSKFNLRGCVNDSESLAHLLVTTYGFNGGDIDILRDSAATRATIMSRLETLLSSAQAGDTIVFGYSGHGTQARSTDSSEPDVKDECLVPYEATYGSLIRDDELYVLFNRYVNEQLKFTAIYDCCHAGTLYRTFAIDEHDNIVEDVINRCLPIEDLLALTTRDSTIGPYNVLSACKDDQTAADLREAGPERVPRGAFSYALHNFLAASRDVPVALADPQIAALISAVSSHTQTPSYQMIDLNAPLIRY
jgi:uncharacterized caspase-like protein